MTKRRHHSPRGLLTLALALTAALVVAASALAAGSSLSLEVKGQYAKVHRTACHKSSPNWRAFHRASTLEYRGFLMPAPASHFQVRIKLERCVAGRWKRVRDIFLTGQSAADSHPGRFKAFYPARPLAPRARAGHPRVSYYRARAYVGTVASPRSYFFVSSH
jgi:hypothetical protein